MTPRPPCRSSPCRPAVADHPGDPRTPAVRPLLAPVDEVYDALVLATRDYVLKNGFTDVVFGLSGGIDSSLVAVIAADAIGPEHVHAVSMPSRYSSEGSKTDADALCEATGIELRTIPIEPAFTAFLEMLAPSFEGLPEDLTEENLQPRIRGTLLMALSNKFRGWLVLTTGNKSELAVGYSTLYGDTAGGFAVIKDVPKLLVYDLCRLRNERAGRRDHPGGGAHQAAVGRAATRPARRPVAPALRASSIRCSRPTSRTTSPEASCSRRASTRRWSTASPGSSTSPSTSAGRTRRARASAPRRSARTGGCRSRTATAGDESTIGGPVRLRRCAHVSSPWAALAAAGGGDLELIIGSYEEDTDHPWHQVERGEMTIVDWMGAVRELGEAKGVEVDFSPLGALLGRDDRARPDRRPRPRPPRAGLQAGARHQQRARGARRRGARSCPSTSSSTS